MELAYFEHSNLPKVDQINCLMAESRGNYSPYHYHDALEIIYLFQGDLTLHQQDTQISLKNKAFSIIPSGTIHATNSVNGNLAMVLQFPVSFLEKYISNTGNYTFFFPEKMTKKQEHSLSQIQIFFSQLYQLNLAPSDFYTLKFNRLTFSLLDELSSNFLLYETADPETIKQNAVMKTVIDYTRLHYNETISIEEISMIAGFNSKYFCRYFKKNMNITYHDYLTQIRFSSIVQELISTKKPLHQLLEIHHFTNYKLFYRLFNEKFHTTPGKFRQNNSRKSPFKQIK